VGLSLVFCGESTHLEAQTSALDSDLGQTQTPAQGSSYDGKELVP
jgi:hypothetical protein